MPKYAGLQQRGLTETLLDCQLSGTLAAGVIIMGFICKGPSSQNHRLADIINLTAKCRQRAS